MHLHYGDLTDATNLVRVMQSVEPDEIYNLAAQSHVAVTELAAGIRATYEWFLNNRPQLRT